MVTPAFEWLTVAFMLLFMVAWFLWAPKLWEWLQSITLIILIYWILTRDRK